MLPSPREARLGTFNGLYVRGGRDAVGAIRETFRKGPPGEHRRLHRRGAAPDGLRAAALSARLHGFPHYNDPGTPIT